MLNKIKILGSSSDGNAYILSFTNGKKIQFDAGKENKDIEKVNELYISHLHPDHYQEKYLKKYDLSKLKIIMPSEEHNIIVPHKVLCNGYIIKEDDEEIAYVTDCGDYSKLDLNLSKCTYLFIECNWDYFLIKQGIIKADRYGWIYAFTNKGHMNNLDTINAIAKWKVNKNCKIILIHKSAHHANFESTYKMFESLSNQIAIAPRDEGTIWCKAWTYTGDETGRILK